MLCLQEAWIFEYLPLGISWDFKALLLDALGDDYKEVVTNEGLLDVDLRSLFGVRIKDQDVILANRRVIIGATETIVFDDQLTLPLPDPIGSQTVYRGLSIAKLKIRGQWYAIGNTHLEAFDAGKRLSQAKQVVYELNDESEPIILVGDLNDQPDSQDYSAYDVIAEDFDDAWPLRLIGRSDPGFTFGREDLTSDDAIFDERIDFGFMRNQHAITLLGLTVGKSQFSKTDPFPLPSDPTSIVRLWPSDHLGLYFILLMPQ